MTPFKFIVYAYDYTNNLKTEKPATIIIEILNVNDNKPIFQKNTYTFDIVENRNHGVLVGQVQAFDSDRSKNRYLKYQLINPIAKLQNKENFVNIKSNRLPFKIDNDGVITIDKKTSASTADQFLDREFVNQYKFHVSASDGDHETKAEVIINLEDENDNYPQFLQTTYKKTVSESIGLDAEILKVTATDRDKNQNGQINYSITTGNKNNIFKINKTTGVLSLNNPLDHERIKHYELILTAKDLGQVPKSNTTKVIINVLDENDHDPIFMESPFILNIKENLKIGTEILKVNAMDQDSGINGVVKYQFDIKNLSLLDGYFKIIPNVEAVKSNFPFEIDSNSGRISVKNELDRESISKYTFQIKAIDGANRSATANIEINIENVNDLPPRFEKTEYFVKISEDMKVGELREDLERAYILFD